MVDYAKIKLINFFINIFSIKKTDWTFVQSKIIKLMSTKIKKNKRN